MEDLFFTVKEAASTLVVTQQTVYDMFKDGRLTKHIIFGRIAVLKSEVSRLAKERGVATNA